MREKTIQEVREELNIRTQKITGTKRQYKVKGMKIEQRGETPYYVCETTIGDIWVQKYT